jgi:anti-sigma regulatory factor (Ser/Thr protein kinase)
MELTLPSRPESATLARQAVTGVGIAERWSSTLLGDITLATGEGCANAVAHAYPSGLSGPVSVRVERSDHDVVLVVADRGTGIRPSARPGRAGLGLGLPLMSAVCRELCVRTVADTSTEIRRTFPFSPMPAADARGVTLT